MHTYMAHAHTLHGHGHGPSPDPGSAGPGTGALISIRFGHNCDSGGRDPGAGTVRR